MPKAFYVVWNPTHGSPTFNHGNFTQAKAEAERLAERWPGSEFFVLLAVSKSKRANVLTEELASIDHDEIEIENDRLPF